MMPHVLHAARDAVSVAPSAMDPAAVVTAVIAPAHIRSIAYPGTDFGSPARTAALRPMVSPWSPVCVVAAMATSPIRSGGSAGLRRSSSRMHADDHVVGSGLGVEAVWPGLPERRPDTVHEHDVAGDTGHDTPPVMGNITSQ